MPDLSKPPWNEIVAILRDDGLALLVIVVVAFVVLRFGRLAIHGIVEALFDREATEGTAQELSARRSPVFRPESPPRPERDVCSG